MIRLARAALAVVVGVALTLVAIRLQHTTAAPTSDREPTPPRTLSTEGEGVVCFGTVDLEQGIASLTSIQPGRVAEVRVAENQHVGQNDELIRLDDEAARLRLDEAEAGVGLARLQLAQAGKEPRAHRLRVAQQRAIVDAMLSRVEAARRALDREKRLAKSNILTGSDESISAERIREAEATERSENHRLEEMLAQDVESGERRAGIELKVAEARRDQARLALEQCRLRAPRPGTVLRILVAPGDVLGNQPAVLFAADGPQVIRATVEQEFAGRVHEGDLATVRDDADPAAAWRGRVGRVAGWYSQRRTILHDPSQLSDVRTLECLIALDPGQPRLRLGQSVRIAIGPGSP